MKKQEKAEQIRLVLEELFPEVPIPLHFTDPYTLLVAVVLSAQCTDERVNKVTPTLFALADNPTRMSTLKIETIEEIIRPCGLSNSKSKAIHRLSEILSKEYSGKVPADMILLEKLPGVGHKTASVVMSQAFGQAAFPVDTHIHRLAYRWGLSDGKNVVQTELDLKLLFAEKYWNKLHLQIIYYGRQYCQARGHSLEKCIICRNYGVKSRLN